jgi:hypothetical protein
MKSWTLFVGFGVFVATLMVVSRTLGWILGLTQHWKATRNDQGPAARFSRLMPIFLHDGPWLLLLVGFGIYKLAGSGVDGSYWPVGLRAQAEVGCGS